MWPFQILVGSGMAMTMPSVTSTAMGAVDRARAGIASGVVNASRQVGGALGIAMLGGIGTTLSASSWTDRISSLPTALQAHAAALTPLVQGGQGARILAITHDPAAKTAALDSFVHGVQGALLTGSALTFAAGIVALVGLRGLRVGKGGEAPDPAAAAMEM
jgi:hypothetical protein